MDFLEKDLEQIIHETDDFKLFKSGLIISGTKLRQLRLGNYGVADIVTVKKLYSYNDGKEKYIPYLLINVIELKKDNIGISAFLQALKYVKAIDRYIEFRGKNIDIKFGITLIGKTIDLKSDYIFLTDYLVKDWGGSSLTLCNYTYHYDIDGIKFKRHSGYCRTSEGFNAKIRLV